ncbi:hypothetical protein ACJX0J_022955, partial [Zea mays]
IQRGGAEMATKHIYSHLADKSQFVARSILGGAAEMSAYCLERGMKSATNQIKSNSIIPFMRLLD